MSEDRLRSTGRRPSLDVAGVQAMLERYMDGSNVSIAELAAEQKLTTATVRKYLKEAGLALPRGRAALKPREVVSVRTLMNRMSLECLIGKGRTELLRRRLEAGVGMATLAGEFGISRDRVRRYRDELGLTPAPREAASEVVSEVGSEVISTDSDSEVSTPVDEAPDTVFERACDEADPFETF